MSLLSLYRNVCLATLLLGLSGWGRSVQAAPDSSSIDSLKQQISQLVQDRQYDEAAKAYVQLGALYQKQYGYNKHTLDAYTNGLNYYHQLGDSSGYYNLHITIGDYYSEDAFMHPYARQYLNRAMQYFKRVNNMPKLLESRLGLANLEQRKEPIAKNLITELRDIEQLSARHRQPYFQAYAQNLLANTYNRNKQPDSAQYFASKSLVLSRLVNVSWLIALNYFYLGLVEQFRNRSTEAIRNYQQSYQLAKAEGNIGLLRELSRHTADSYSRMGDYKNAYASSLKTLDFTNELNSWEQTKSIRLKELDAQIKTLAVEKQLAEEQSQHQHVLNSMLVAGLIISILGVIALFYLRRQQKLITHQQAVIAQQQIRQLETKSLQAMIEGQESERSRIARDLHDGLGIQLSRIKLFVEAHQELLPLSVKEPLNQFLDEACKETRLISNDLRPYALSMFGLLPALEDLVQKLNLVNQTRLTIEHYGEVPDLSDEASVMIYRVVQELLNNALKHAQADTITVQIMTNDEAVLISVDDDGRGGDFDTLPSKGNGIANIHSRIDYLGGHVEWHSEPGKGTSVMISLPMKKLVLNPQPFLV
ncbi:sensor histidine kinase [Nibrella saemangeumensis]|uniref:Oxygen sensor histidine kinase NreB n=1 Tax=Nibrella saemangeumensis TaxID=1084526 RepID=A0ABP8MEN4_9BACT